MGAVTSPALCSVQISTRCETSGMLLLPGGPEPACSGKLDIMETTDHKLQKHQRSVQSRTEQNLPSPA